MMTFSPISILLSNVAELICGNKKTLSNSFNLGLISLPLSKTSKAAPANSLDLSIRVSAFSSIISPLAVLII